MVLLLLSSSFFVVMNLLIVDSPLLMILLMLLTIFLFSGMIGCVASKWFFCAIMLVYAGGMMVLFFYCLSVSVYVSSVSVLKMKYLPLAGVFFFLPSGFVGPFWGSAELYNYSNIISGGLLIFYLFIGLFSTVKISESFKGSLQKVF